uniref:Lrp/AsnC ligand binding domain-containing protein n=1 Tax=uncultured Arenimonas sp. TaxID=546226 RepID=UPI0030DD533B
RLARHSRPQVEAFHAHLLALPEVLSLYHVAGADDFLVHVGVRDSDHLRDFAMAALTSREEVAHIETHLIFAFKRSTDLPVYLDGDEA